MQLDVLTRDPISVSLKRTNLGGSDATAHSFKEVVKIGNRESNKRKLHPSQIVPFIVEGCIKCRGLNNVKTQMKVRISLRPLNCRQKEVSRFGTKRKSCTRDKVDNR